MNGEGMNFSEFLSPKWFKFLRNSGCGMIWKLTQINVNVTPLSLNMFFSDVSTSQEWVVF